MNWKSFTLSISDLDLDRNEIYLNLGYAGTQPDEHIIELIQKMVEEISVFCKPQAGFVIKEGLLKNDNYLVLENQSIKVGTVITKYLQKCTQFAVFIATAGMEFDDYCNRFKTEGDILSDFFAYSIGTEIAEAMVRYISKRIFDEAAEMNLNYTHSYSPGYCSWHVREQKNLFKIMPEKPCGVLLNESNLMFPEKSVSGIIGLGENIQTTAHSCEICSMINCFKRKI